MRNHNRERFNTKKTNEPTEKSKEPVRQERETESAARSTETTEQGSGTKATDAAADTKEGETGETTVSPVVMDRTKRERIQIKQQMFPSPFYHDSAREVMLLKSQNITPIHRRLMVQNLKVGYLKKLARESM